MPHAILPRTALIASLSLVTATSTGCLASLDQFRSHKAKETPKKLVPVASLAMTEETYCVNRTIGVGLEFHDAAGAVIDPDNVEPSIDKLVVKTDPAELVTNRASGTTALMLQTRSPITKSLEPLGADVTLTATLGTLTKTFKLKPTFCPEPVALFRGRDGAGGSGGPSGGSTPGGSGGRGGNGGNGDDAEPLRIEADFFKGPGGAKLVAVVVARASGEVDWVVVHDPSKGPLAIDARGGAGGMGGSGGFAADCGNGGDGGNGGNGGRGADVSLVVGDAAIADLLEIDVGGGGYGSAGSGSGGGMILQGSCTSTGQTGRSGEPGRGGAQGRLKVSVKKKPALVRDVLATCSRCGG